jgi:uncharacterized membrane protein YphA (DoxX/SURF4 family)
MTTTLWIIQGILAVIFFMAGVMKVIKSPDELVEMGMGYAGDMSASSITIIGLLEVLAAVGLILPVALSILPMLTGWAGVGVVLTMIGAMVVHIRRGETSQIVVNIIIGAMGGFVAYSHLL